MRPLEYIKQGEYKITNGNICLTTSGLATCTALGIKFRSNAFLSHIDAMTNITPIIEDLKKILTSNFQSAQIWSGSGVIAGINADSSVSTKKAEDILKALNISNPLMSREDVITLGDIIQCNICKMVSGTLKILSHCVDCKYKGKVYSSKVVYWEDVYI